jgi:integrase
MHLVPAAQRVFAEAAQSRQAMRYRGPFVSPGQTGEEISAINGCLTTACQIAGVQRFVSHSLRSNFINFRVKQGVPLAIASRSVGHERIDTIGATTRRSRRKSVRGMPSTPLPQSSIC